MKKLFIATSICCLLISCSSSSDNIKATVKIELFEALSNPEAYELIKEIESEYVSKTMDTSEKKINLLDNRKYHPLTSTLHVYNKMCNYHADTASFRSGPCGFCAYAGFEKDEIKFIDSILNISDKISGKYDRLWSPIIEICGEVYFLSILTRNNLSFNDRDVKEMVIEDYSPQKLMSYPLFDYDTRRAGTKVLSVKWNDRTKQRIDSLYGNKRSVVCVVTINNRSYISGELDSLNSGVTLRDVNLTEGLLDSLSVYFPRN